MDYNEQHADVPAGLLSSLEDLTAEILGLQELVLAVAASAQYLSDALPADGAEQMH